MTNYRENPEKAPEEFKTFVDQVASSVSLKDIQNDSVLTEKEEWLNYNSDLLRITLNKAVNKIYAQIDFQEKLSELHKLERGNCEEAWRPVLGKADLLSIEGDHLKEKKSVLNKELELIRKQSSALKLKVQSSREEIQEQGSEIAVILTQCANKIYEILDTENI